MTNELPDPVGSPVILSTEFSGKDRRTIGSLIIIGLIAIVAGIILLQAAVLYAPLSDNVDRLELLKEINTDINPGTVIIAVISSLGGLAAGVGLRNRGES